MRQILQKNDEIRMTNPTRGHPEHSEAESKGPAALPTGIATELKAWPRGLRPLRSSLDFARNDRSVPSSLGPRASFVICS
jgi:hypothetical protein